MSGIKSKTTQKPASAGSQKRADSPEPKLEPATASEVRTKLDLARQFLDMGDPESARHMLDEVLKEGDSSQREEAQRLLDSMP